MTVRVIEGRCLRGAEVRAWAEIQAAQPEFANPYFCPEFTQAMACVRDDVCVAILEQRGEPVGFFPFHKLGDGAAEPIGGRLSDYEAVIVRAEIEWRVEDLFRAAGIRCWPFRHLLECQEQFRPYRTVGTRSFVLDLSSGFDAYAEELRARGSQAIGKIERLAGSLEALTLDLDSRSAEDLEWLIGCKSEQYRRSGRTDRFEIPWIREAIVTLHGTHCPRFSGMLSVLKAGGQIVAAHFGMRSQSVWHYWFPCYHVGFGRYSPGLILLLEMARAAPGMGFRSIDLGAGEADYKTRFSNASVPLARGVVTVS